MSILLTFCIIFGVITTNAASAEIYTGFRLPGHVIPRHYELVYRVSLEKCSLNASDACGFRGGVLIDIVTTTELDEIVLHAGDKMAIHDADLDLEGSFQEFPKDLLYLDDDAERKRKIRAARRKRKGSKRSKIIDLEVTLFDSNDMVHLLLPSTLPPGNYQLLLEFQAEHRRNNLGFYVQRNTERPLKIKNNLMLSTQFEPFWARTAFPCFDEPAYKATFKITVFISADLYSDGYSVLSNTPLERMREFTFQGGDVGFEFEKTPVPMSTYLVAIIVSDYVEGAKTTFRSAYANENPVKEFRTMVPRILDPPRSLNSSQNMGPIFLEYFTKLYGMGYVFPKLDQIPIPQFTMGAMENWGLITYRFDTLLPKLRDSVSNHLDAISVIAHELSHQWFGNVVTIDWWNNLWLAEGFASLHESLISDLDLSGVNAQGWKALERFVTTIVQAQGLVYDSLPSALALSAPTDTHKAIDAKFSHITYGKGGAVLRMWMHTLGREVFFEGLRDYLRKNALGVGTPTLLLQSISTAQANNPVALEIPTDIPDLLSSWFEEPGYPLLKVKRVGKQLIITQERFEIGTKNKDIESKWYVPITCSTNQALQYNKTSPDLFLKKGSTEAVIWLDHEPEWFTLNNQLVGFYRVMYDPENLKALQKVLSDPAKTEMIHPLNRAEIIDDAFHLAIAQYTSLLSFLRLSTSLKNEDHFAPWRTFARNIRLILTSLSSEDRHQALYDAISSFTQKLVREGLQRMKKRQLNSIADMLLKEDLLKMTIFLRMGGPKDHKAKRIVFFEDKPTKLSMNAGEPFRIDPKVIFSQRIIIMKFIKAESRESRKIK